MEHFTGHALLGIGAHVAGDRLATRPGAVLDGSILPGQLDGLGAGEVGGERALPPRGPLFPGANLDRAGDVQPNDPRPAAGPVGGEQVLDLVLLLERDHRVGVDQPDLRPFECPGDPAGDEAGGIDDDGLGTVLPRRGGEQGGARGRLEEMPHRGARADEVDGRGSQIGE